MPQLEDFLIEKEEEQEKISIGERLQNLAIRYLPWWPLFALLLVLGIVGGWVYLRYATPLYQIKASILIKDDKSGIDESKLLESLNIFGDKKNVENEIQVILSRTLATQVATELHLYAPIMQEGNIKDAPAFHSSPMIVEARYPDSMQAPGGDGKILFQYDSARSIVTIDKQPYKTGEWIRSPYGEIRFLDNPWYNHDPSDRQLYFTLANPEDVGLALLKNLEEPPARTHFILISHRPHRLPRTIISRCRQLNLQPPDRATALAWLDGQGVADPEVALAQSSGAPLLALATSEGDELAGRRDFLSRIAPPDFDPLAIAETFRDLPLERFIGWLQPQISRREFRRLHLSPHVEGIRCRTAHGLQRK